MPKIERLTALEILDSRGRPTVSATCTLASGATAAASVPSGASTGAAEKHELRDGDPKRYDGLGCRKAVTNINGEIHSVFRGRSFESQSELDQALLTLDGTAEHSRLGNNAILAVSLSFARAVAAERGVPLYQHFADLLGSPPRKLPRLTVNLFSGGKHAGAQVEIQDVLIVPSSAGTIDESLAMTYAVYQAAARRCLQRYKMRALAADEGGLAPPFPTVEAMLDDAVAAIEGAGFEPGKDVAIAVDVASSHFMKNDRYHIGGKVLDTEAMVARIGQWVARYPIISVEDGLGEFSPAWPKLRESLAGKALTLGDDYLCTNPEKIRRAIEQRAADALLLKINQIGTLTEASEAYHLARDAGWQITISARSGETEDNWLADLAVGWSGDQIKIGSITRSERLAKYNRLLEIEAETHLPVATWPRNDSRQI